MSVVGVSHPIHDAAEKASGSAVYAGDMRLKGMVYGALVRSPIANGYVEDLDFSQAAQVPGVVGWLSCLEEWGKPFCRYRTIKGQKTADQERVWNRRVRFVGDRVGCVLAKSQEAARRAAQLVEVRCQEYPAALTVEDSLSGAVPPIHPEGNVGAEVCVEVGELPAGDFVPVSTRTRLSRINHSAMEPHVCTADYNPRTGELTIWSPSQSVHGLRTVLGDIFSLPYHKVRVIKTTMGGSFGGKQEWMAEPAAAAAAIYRRGPVQLVLSREEVLQSTICRAPMDLKVEGLYTPEGKLVSFQVDNTLEAGAYLGNSQDYCGAMANKFFRCYRYPHMKYTGRPVITNTPVSGAFRGWTSPELATCLEHNLNMAARKLGIDPVELRLQNAARPGDMDIRLEQPLGEIRLVECLKLGREKFHWDQRRREDEAFNSQGGRFRRGSAVACGGHLSGYFPRMNDFSAVEMRMTETGDVLVNVTLHDHGCGTVEAFRMIVAEVLGLTPEQVRVPEGDTSVTPFDYGCFSSRTTYVIGRAAENCARKLLDRLRQVASRLYGMPAARLIPRDGALVLEEEKPAGSESTVETAVRRFLYPQLVQESHGKLQQEIFASEQYINQSNPGVTGAHFAQVEVDTATGVVKILDYLAVHDIGRAINPEICRGQVQGAVLMGAGAALSEEVTVDKRGRGTGSLGKYHLLNMPEAPEIQVEFVEDGGTDGPFGAKSIGEVCHVPVAAAIVGAVNQALGAELCHIPLNPDRIGAWLEEQEEHGCR